MTESTRNIGGLKNKKRKLECKCFILLQKPLMLHGHERAITKIKYNREGDLLFSSSKDKMPNVWYSLNGERLGTFNGHNGSVWCIDVNWDTSRLLSGSGDNTLRVWDCQTGSYSILIEFSSYVRYGHTASNHDAICI